MEIEEVDSNDQYKVLNVTLSAGEAMPLHYTTSEAMLIGRKGKGICRPATYIIAGRYADNKSERTA